MTSAFGIFETFLRVKDLPDRLLDSGNTYCARVLEDVAHVFSERPHLVFNMERGMVYFGHIEVLGTIGVGSSPVNIQGDVAPVASQRPMLRIEGSGMHARSVEESKKSLSDGDAISCPLVLCNKIITDKRLDLRRQERQNSLTRGADPELCKGGIFLRIEERGGVLLAVFGSNVSDTDVGDGCWQLVCSIPYERPLEAHIHVHANVIFAEVGSGHEFVVEKQQMCNSLHNARLSKSSKTLGELRKIFGVGGLALAGSFHYIVDMRTESLRYLLRCIHPRAKLEKFVFKLSS